MDILLIGGMGSVTRALINKLSKEGHRIYLLTGSEEETRKPQKVFEQYRFTYDNECIKEVFESIKPDVTVFTGAFDSNMNWENSRTEAARYSAGLVNILMAASLQQSGRFIYLSSSEVFEESHVQNITEEAKPRARQFRSMTILQGERQCRDYGQMMNMDVVILRLDHLYWTPQKKSEVSGVPDRMILTALKTSKLTPSEKNVFSLLFLSDAVECIYKVIAAEKHNDQIYQISSSEAITELELAKLIKQSLPKTEITSNSAGEQCRIILSNQRFADEFGIAIYHKPESAVLEVCNAMKHHKREFIGLIDDTTAMELSIRKKLQVIIKAFVPFAENLLCFIPIFYLNHISAGSQYFAKFDFYLLYVLLFAVVYGQQQATFSAILAVIGYFVRQIYYKTTFEVVIDYNTYVWIVQLFIVGMVVGYLKDKLKVVKTEDGLKIEYLQNQLKNIENINNNNANMKNILINQIVNQNDSFGKIYEITSSLDKYESGEVLFYAAEALSRIMNTEDVAIYTVANHSYARLFSSTSQKARTLGNSIEYKGLESLYEAISHDRVYVNKEMNPDYPLMADGIYEGDELKIILMIWGIPWERMTLSQANMFRVVGYLISSAVSRANKYLDALSRDRYIIDTHILEPEAFRELIQTYLDAKNRNLTQCVVVKIDASAKSMEQTGEEVSKMLRQSDYMGTLGDGKISVLLANTSAQESHYVTDRLMAAGFSAEVMEDMSVCR